MCKKKHQVKKHESLDLRGVIGSEGITDSRQMVVMEADIKSGESQPVLLGVGHSTSLQNISSTPTVHPAQAGNRRMGKGRMLPPKGILNFNFFQLVRSTSQNK